MRFALSILLLFGFAAGAQVIPTSRTYPWTGNVGLRTNIIVRPDGTNDINITQAPYNAVGDGKTDCSTAVQNALNAAISNQVVYVPNGNFLISNSALTMKTSYVTIRGQSTNANFIFNGNQTFYFSVGPTQDNPTDQFFGDYIISGATKGSTSISVSNNTGISFIAGQEIYITENTAQGLGTSNFPVINVHQGDHSIQHVIRVTTITGSSPNYTVGLSVPLMFDFTNNPIVIQQYKFGQLSGAFQIGLENLTITASNPVTQFVGTGGFLGVFSLLCDSWITNCNFLYAHSYNVSMADCTHCYFGHNNIEFTQGGGSDHSGLLFNSSGEDLIEDNIFAGGLSPAIELNTGACVNAFYGNFFTNNSGFDILYHNTHPMFNLWEGNKFGNYFEMDGYFGSASHQTLFRNALTCGFLPIKFNRFISYCNVVGNIIGGQTGFPAITSLATTNNGANNTVFALGFPGISGLSYNAGSTSPPGSWDFPGTNYIDSGGISRPNGLWIASSNYPVGTTNLPATGIGTDTFTNIYAGQGGVQGGVFTLLFKHPNTDQYYPSNGSVCYVTNSYVPTNVNNFANATNLQIVATTFIIPAGAILYQSGQGSYQYLYIGNNPTATAYTNGVYTHYIGANYIGVNYGSSPSLLWMDVPQQNIPASILYSSGPPSWWTIAGTNAAFPMVDITNNIAYVIPAEARYDNIGGSGPAIYNTRVIP
jgi:hypothetical protein